MGLEEALKMLKQQLFILGNRRFILQKIREKGPEAGICADLGLLVSCGSVDKAIIKMCPVIVTRVITEVIRNMNSIETRNLPTHLGKSVGKVCCCCCFNQFSFLESPDSNFSKHLVSQSVNKYLWPFTKYYTSIV